MALLLHAVLLLAVSASVVMSSGASSGTGYVRYFPGTLNMILSAPHGGSSRPRNIPIRNYGCFRNNKCVWSHKCGTKDKRRCKTKNIADLNTGKLTRLVREHLMNMTGQYPHVVYNSLHRSRMDANREKAEATFGVATAVQAWNKYHKLLTDLRRNMTSGGILFDIHGYGQTENYILLGYLISKAALVRDSAGFTEYASIKKLMLRHGAATFRGNTSFGAFLEKERFSSIPSNQSPVPCRRTYYSGGYIVKRHGSRYNGEVDAIQIESPRVFRHNDMVEEYAESLARAMLTFYNLHYR